LTDFPCKCGHAKTDHGEYSSRRILVCEGCFKLHFNKTWDKIEKLACSVYKPDNLKYLEQLSAKTK